MSNQDVQLHSMRLPVLTVDAPTAVFASGQLLSLALNLSIRDICLFNPVLRLSIRHPGGEMHLFGSDTHESQLFYPWLPCGEYRFNFSWPVSLPAGCYELCIGWGSVDEVRQPDVVLPIQVQGELEINQVLAATWYPDENSKSRINALSWQKGMSNWFHRHFCHAALVIGESFLAKTPQLQGRILDIGAGEGITDLGLFLRYRPSELVAMDIVDYFESLPRVARENDLPLDALPEGLTFVQGSCENVPYDDASFDIVLSWGSLEHIVGGYRRALDEVWRVLKPGGLFFVNPGLFYSAYGSHLGEFSQEPHLHLKISEEKLRDLVMNSRPDIMDRAGFDVSNADYWRFYKELNIIRVAEFEAELKGYGYTIVRAAIRASEMVEYSTELQSHSVLDLAVEDAFFTLKKPELPGV
ncbi:MAG: methyltransferase domain-containing protein [Sulfuricellaceae bacterium]|nr:methyltransferase domain-containing protein [Sulfuricellaceae bacterium]